MKVVITGRTGFIGQRVLDLLLADEDITYVESLTTQFRPQPQLGNKFGEKILTQAYDARYLWMSKPDVIIHLGATSHANMGICIRDARMTAVNTLWTHELIENCPENCRFIFASSMSVFGGGFVDDNSIHRPKSAYAATKAAAENLIEITAQKRKLNFLVCRLVAQVGGNSTHGLLHDIVRKLRANYAHRPVHDAVVSSEPLELIGRAPGSCKPFSWVGDTARAIVEFAKNRELTGFINMSPDGELYVEQVARLAMNALNIKRSIQWNPYKVWQGDEDFLSVVNSSYMKNFSPICRNSAQSIGRALEEYLGTNT